MAEDRLRSFAEFWPHYVHEHSRPATRLWHIGGTTLALALLVAAAASRFWWLLLAAPICGYALAWISHMAIEHNRPATFTYPIWSLAADFKMWGLAVTGRLRGETERILGGQTGRESESA